jgi:hypothetical protein
MLSPSPTLERKSATRLTDWRGKSGGESGLTGAKEALHSRSLAATAASLQQVVQPKLLQQQQQ